MNGAAISVSHLLKPVKEIFGRIAWHKLVAKLKDLQKVASLISSKSIVEFVTSFSSTPRQWNSKKGILSKELMQSVVYTHTLCV